MGEIGLQHLERDQALVAGALCEKNGRHSAAAQLPPSRRPLVGTLHTFGLA